MPNQNKEVSKRTFLLLGLILATLVIFACGSVYFVYSRNQIINNVFSTLESIGEWKLQQIVDWRDERKVDLKVLLSDNFVIQTNLFISNQDEDAKEYITDRFIATQEGGRIQSCLLLDSELNTVLSTNTHDELLTDATKSAITQSQLSNEPIVSDIFKCTSDYIHIDVVSSLKDNNGDIYGYIILRIDAEDYLFPLIKSWPLQSETAENLLFEVEGDNILFLNELRHIDNAALEFTIPLTNKDLPAVKVAEGEEGIIIGYDYRDVKAIAFGSAVPETDWYILSKVDYIEAFKDIRLQLMYIALIIALLIILCPILILFFVKKKNLEVSRRLFDAEYEKNQTNTLFKFVLNSLPQRIFWKDLDYKYTGCNKSFALDRGYDSEDDIAGLTDYSFFGPEKAGRIRTMDEEILSTLVPRTGYEVYRFIDNKDVWYRESKVPIYDESENVIGILGTYEDITATKKLNSELNRHANLLQAIFENANALLFSTDTAGTLTFMEGKILKKLNIKPISKASNDFISVFDDKEIADALIKALSGSPSSAYNIKISNTILDFFFQPSFEDEKVNAVYGIAVDTTDLHKAINNLERSNKELEQFAYVASHDLQEPLRMVANFTQLLEQKYADKLDERANKYIYYAVDGAKRMQNLINDLLNYSRINTREKEHSQVDMNKTLAQVVHNLSAAIEEANAKVTYDNLPIITAEATQMYQLLLNLVSNAIKFKGKEPPVIKIKSSQTDEHWKFEISDNGIGIEEKYSDRIFQIFQRLHSRSEYDGTGIGLALCKRIASKHGGNIWFESEPGKGTTFIVTISKRKENNYVTAD